METLLNKKQLLTFEFDFSGQQPLPTNPMFSYGKARILYIEHNRNNSYFSKESIQKALPTLFGIPIVGEFDEETNNFKGHGGKVEISDDGVKFIDTTMPFGYVSEESNFTWETVQHLDGTTKEYLVADKCVFWTGRYPQLNGLFDYGKYNQSMEIEVTNGEFAVIDGQETFRIDDFVFSALCILGVNTPDDPDGHVEPCFEEASIGLYSQQKTFSNKFKFMLEELKNPKEEPTGGQPMSKENKHSFSSKQLFVMLSRALGEMKDVDFKYLDHTENAVVFSDKEDKVFEAEYSITEDALTINMENKKDSEYKLTEDEQAFVNAEVTALETALETAKSEFATQLETEKATLASEHENAMNVLNGEFEVFKSDTATKIADLDKEKESFKAKAEKVESLEAELATLQEYKRASEENGIKEKFSGKLEADVLETIIKDNAGKSVEVVEALIFAEIGKASFSAKPNKTAPSGVAVPAHEEDDEPMGLYAQLKNKHYANKQ